MPVLGIGVPAPTDGASLATAGDIKAGGNILMQDNYIKECGGIGVGQDASATYSLISGKPIRVGTYAPDAPADEDEFTESYITGILNVASDFDMQGKHFLWLTKHY